MGEIAEGMMDGTLCCVCGVYLGADFGPSPCPDCAAESEAMESANEWNGLKREIARRDKDAKRGRGRK